MGLGTDQRTTVTEAKFLPEVWAPEVQMAYEDNLVTANLVKSFDALSRGNKTINVPKVANRAAQNKAFNTQVVLTGDTATDFTITINTHKHSADLIEDFAQAQTNYELRSIYTQKQGFAVADALDVALLSLYTDADNNVGNNTAGITQAKWTQAIRILDTANVPLRERYGIIEAYGREDIHNLDNFVRYDATGKARNDNPIVNGFQGNMFGVDTYFDNNVVTTAGTPNTVHGVIMQREAFAKAVPVGPRTQGDYILQYLGTLVVTDLIYAVGTYRSNAVVDLRYAQS